ncbi:hybrid sensor histidine kinase/response regulator [Thiocapsa roseopersicina]|uniref:histidine kinase n=1 Tax=Thiocapsa roseopersicina TaxID=1058 RepID=A0A1H3D033_THIRO|nr:hybrid sensor histidine kinase/response regulator [Thiocapsa roseopersicina]SDX59650.1 Signal transduction histidine kinase [Thiocapsa roseopersicina]
MFSGIQARLLLILGLAALAITLASAMALMALLETRAGVATVMERELPASNAALVLARVGERLEDRAPALLAAKDAEARQRQTALINRDLRSLASETERLRDLHPAGSDGVADIARLAPELAANLRDLALALEQQAALGVALQDQRERLLALRERVQQTLGPSILLVSDVVGRDTDVDPGLFRRAARAQGPLLDAERLAGSAFSDLLLGAESPSLDQVRVFRGSFERTRGQLADLLPRIPSGLRPELAQAIADLEVQLQADGVFRLREQEIATIEGAESLVTASRGIAAALKTRVDALVHSASETIARAADAMGDTLLTNTLIFVAVSIAVVLLATLISYRFLVRDISLNLRAVAHAMQRLAGGERDARVPAMDRRDEIGDLARVFNVFKDNAFRMETVEGQLRQAQKMELVGQLTGGIAHDFNNILAAILGNLTYLEPKAGGDPMLRERWQRAMGATDRAVRQVERLLAFSRRQRLAPEVVDINALVGGMLDLLEVSVAEGTELSALLAPDLPRVRVDPGQLENALMNLVINARDALDGGGRISVTTAAAGDDAVEVAVEDTGRGIPADVLERVCEPFFTTKAPGKGSGLGLSMVYGFARQSGGEMRIESRIGEGTTVRIRLPVAEPSATVSEHIADPVRDANPPQGNGECLLAVDDDSEVLATTADQLRGLGYRVLTAGDGATALELLQQEPAIRLLYTDVAMPAPWDGVSLAREARSRRPELAILFTSGETREIRDPSAALLRKPVGREHLAQAVRQALDDE